MTNQLPPLTALRAFDAAARHLSFSQAAHELNVTPAALSFQIKSLEDHLGVPLFHRRNRAVSLTEAGRTLAPGAADGFAQLAAAWRATRRLQGTPGLTITAGPAFTAKWLAPRLFEFAQAHPEIELRFSASLRIVDFEQDDIDVAIRFGAGTDDGLYSMPLAEEWVTPVMTPELATQFPEPADLHKATLIVDESTNFLKPAVDWGAWFSRLDLGLVPSLGPRFSQADHAIDAALSGTGVVLGRRALVVKDIADGRLVAPYGIAMRAGARFRFICRNGSEEQSQIAAFRSWILSEIEKTAHITDALTLIGPKT